MNAQIEQRINEYAKANKTNRAKLLEFVQSLIDEMPVRQDKPAGRKPTIDALSCREAMAKLRQEVWKPEGFTALQLAEHINTAHYVASNALSWLAENEGSVYVAGTASKPAGQRGKAPKLWMWKD
jgi:response regulator of citrate/malate metabolism